MAESNGFFARMCKEAQDEIANGEKGWKAADTNTLLLACFGLLTNHLTHSLTRPLWLFSSAVVAGAVGYLINLILGV